MNKSPRFGSLNREQYKGLERVFSEEEINWAVSDCGGDKVPGPNGFNFSFVKHSMDIHKLDIMVFM